MRLTKAHSLVWLGLASNRHIFFGLLVTIGLVHGSPIDLVRLDEHLLRERITQDVHEYIRGLPSDALPQIVDEIDFDDLTQVRNDQLFSFACIKIRQMEAEGVVYEKDGPIEKLTRFINAKLARGDVTFGPVAMVSLTGIEHPLIIALAKDLLDCDHELTRDNAARLLKEYERKLNTRNGGNLQRPDPGGREDEPGIDSNADRPSAPQIEHSEGAESRMSWRTWGLVIGTFALLAALGFLVKSKRC